MPNRKSDRPETVKKETVIDTGANLLIDLLINRWGVRHVFGYRGDGINGGSKPFDADATSCSLCRCGTRRRRHSLRPRTPSSPASSALALATSGPRVIHLLNGLYDAKAGSR